MNNKDTSLISYNTLADKIEGFNHSQIEEEFKEEVIRYMEEQVYEEYADVRGVEPSFKIKNGQRVHQGFTRQQQQQQIVDQIFDENQMEILDENNDGEIQDDDEDEDIEEDD